MRARFSAWSRRTRRTRGVLVAFGALAVLGAVLVPAGAASPPSSGIKQASVCLQVGSTPGLPCATVSELPGGQTVALTFTVTNANTSTQAIGSANLDVPVGSGISIVANSAAFVANTGVAGQTFGTNTSSELQLRNLNLPPTSSVSVNFSVTTPCSGSNLKWGPLSSGPDEKQSNNFSGTGNDFNNTSSAGFTSSIVAGANGAPDHLAFSGQPGDGKTATAGSPSAKVTMYDSCGNVTNAADGNAVTVALQQPADQTFGGTGTLSGTVSEPLSSGVASFGDLQVSASGAYTLKASYTGLADVTSNTFNIFDIYGDCSFGCSGAGPDGTTSLQIQVSGGGNTGVGFGSAANNHTVCTGNTALKPLGGTFTIVPPVGAVGNITATLTIAKRGLQGVGVSNIVVCKNGGPGTPLVQMSQCAKKNPKAPCIVSQTSSNAGDAKITMLITPTDPGGSGFG